MACCSDCAKTGGSCGGGHSHSHVSAAEGLGTFDMTEWVMPHVVDPTAFEGQMRSSAGPLTQTPADRIMAPYREAQRKEQEWQEGFMGISGDTWLMIGAGVVVVGALMGGRRR